MIVGLDVSVRRVGAAFVASATGLALHADAATLNMSDGGFRMLRPLEFLDDAHAAAVGASDECIVDAVYVELPAYPRSSGPEAAFNAGRALQVVVDAVREAWTGAPVELLRPSQWQSRAQVHLNRGTTLADLEARYPAPWPSRSSAKPPVYARACDLGFRPGGSQDAADAACIAFAGWRTERDPALRDKRPTRRRAARTKG